MLLSDLPSALVILLAQMIMLLCIDMTSLVLLTIKEQAILTTNLSLVLEQRQLNLAYNKLAM